MSKDALSKYVEVITWPDIRARVRELNPSFAEVIDSLAPSNDLKLIKVRYPYGEKITKQGEICLPGENNQFYPLSSSLLPKYFREQLGYCPTPLIMQLHHNCEAFVPTEGRIMPLNVFWPGDLYGLFEAIAPLTQTTIIPRWDVSSGCRSVFMLPKITDSARHKRLAGTYKYSKGTPASLIDHWDIFKAIVNQASDWQSEVLLFTKDWFIEKPDDCGWLKFFNHLLVASWVQSNYMRRRTEHMIAWEKFAEIIRNRNLKPGSYLIDTVRHLTHLAHGFVPGFQVAKEDSQSLPVSLIQEAYCRDYGLREYAPTIMEAARLRTNIACHDVYYSLSYPTLVEGTPNIRKKPNVIQELRDVKGIMEVLLKIFRQESQQGRVDELLLNSQYHYFHCEADRYDSDLNEQGELLAQDFLTGWGETGKNHAPLSTNNLFLRGCIKVSTPEVKGEKGLTPKIVKK